jgi:hypothetical protein
MLLNLDILFKVALNTINPNPPIEKNILRLFLSETTRVLNNLTANMTGMFRG